MTKLCNSCEYLKYCARSGIEEVGCDRYKRDTTTNEEWLRSLNTEQLAEALAWIEDRGELPTVRKENVKAFEKWLKEKHDDH